MDVDAFIAELDGVLAAALARIGEAAKAPPAAEVSIPDLLAVALRNELEASEEAAIWMAGEKDLELKLGLARQCGDEARHYRLVEARLLDMGVDVARLDPQARGPSPLFRYLRTLQDPAERLAAGPFAREGLAIVRNEIFAAYCESKGDGETARLYREVIGPDERHHHELGRRLLRRYAVTQEDQDRARAAAQRTLYLSEELQETARLKHGISSAPGC